MVKIKDNNQLSKKTWMDEKSEINFMKPSKEKSAFGAFLSDEFCCDGCGKYLKTKDGAFFCY